MKWFILFFSFGLCLSSYASEDEKNEICHFKAHAVLMSEKEALWHARLRSRALFRLDKILSWALPLKERVFHLHEEEEGINFISQSEAMVAFAKQFSYFSKKRPVISTVSSEKEDITLCCHLFEHIFSHCKNEEFLQMASAEILSKVIAFRDLSEGMQIPVPCALKGGGVRLVNYRVDKVFTLWPCMPAFGLIPEDDTASAILLFRGTDLSLESKRGWASVLSDLDIQGPGLTAFMKSKDEIEKWLKNSATQNAKPIVMGFSLGGVLALYTSIYEHEWLSSSGSYAFNPPGVSLSVYKMWKELSLQHKDSIDVYVTRGDIIPKIGVLPGRAYELSIDSELRPVDAHVRLMCCQPNLYRFKINITEENRRRR